MAKSTTLFSTLYCFVSILSLKIFPKEYTRCNVTRAPFPRDSLGFALPHRPAPMRAVGASNATFRHDNGSVKLHLNTMYSIGNRFVWSFLIIRFRIFVPHWNTLLSDLPCSGHYIWRTQFPSASH